MDMDIDIKAILDKTQLFMELKGLSQHTISAYQSLTRRFLERYPLEPAEYNEGHVLTFMHDLFVKQNYSGSYASQALGALKILFENVFRREGLLDNVPHRKRNKALPFVLSQEEVFRILRSTKSLTEQALLMAMYSSGLRIGEVCRLKNQDIESKRGLIRVNQGKGKKDRYTVLSKVLVQTLRQYYRQERPRCPGVNWLFPERKDWNRPTDVRRVRKIFNDAKERAGITKPATPHTLRHCFATHSLESGIDIFRIQKMMGHASIRTTCIYLHVQMNNQKDIISPLDMPLL